MSTITPTSVDGTEAEQPLEARRERARVVASFAEYLAQDVHGNPDRALEAMASLAEWCEGDAELVVEARAAVRQDTRKVARRAQAVVAQNRDAIELLELVAQDGS